mgnify:CR=1 FL=1
MGELTEKGGENQEYENRVQGSSNSKRTSTRKIPAFFSGYAAVFWGNVDSGGDIIEPGAFTKTIAEGWERVKNPGPAQ